MKKENKQTVILTEPVLFDHQVIDHLTFDLVYINEGWDNEIGDYAYKSKSDYSSEEIVDFFEQLENLSAEWIIDVNKLSVKTMGVHYFRYIGQATDEQGHEVRIVLDLPLRATGEAIIVTVFKIG